MQPYDMKILGERLNELAEVFDKKPVGEKALAVWFNVLREFPTEKVCGALIGWPKTHTKFPAPSEVWKSVNDMSIGERESKAKAEARIEFTPGVGGEQAGKFIEKMREILKQPKFTPEQHWRRNLKRFPKGHIGHEAVIYALAKKGLIEEREPGQDDEELRDAA